jgi:hypothetical protein
VFYDAVFARVIRDHGKDAAVRELAPKHWQRRRQRLHLIVDSDSHSLKNPREIARPGS